MSRSPFRSVQSDPTVTMKLHIRKLMADIASDHIMLSEVVAGGNLKWRNEMHAAFRPLPLTDDICDRVFLFFCGAVQALLGAGTAFNSEHMEAAAIAGEFLDKVEPILPPTPDEVDKAWTIEDASSESAKKEQYGDLAPQEWLDRLVQKDRDDEKAGRSI